MQPQTLGVPPPPQVWGTVQVPQSRVPPQPSGTSPQLSPAGHLVIGVVQPHLLAVPPPPQVWGAVQVPQPGAPQQPHALGVPPPPQVWGALQVPQLITLPQLSSAVPQSWPMGQVVMVGVQPHWLGTPPPPQVSLGLGQVRGPQLTLLPQPLEMLPQLLPAGQAVRGLQAHVLVLGSQVWGAVHWMQPGPQQPHLLGVPPPPHICPAVGHMAPPHMMVPPQPSDMEPQSLPPGQAVRGMHPHVRMPLIALVWHLCPEMQSVSWMHFKPSAQRAGQVPPSPDATTGPPQSTSVSEPSTTPSAHCSRPPGIAQLKKTTGGLGTVGVWGLASG